MQKRAGDGRPVGARQEPAGGLHAALPCPWALVGGLWGCPARPRAGRGEV